MSYRWLAPAAFLVACMTTGVVRIVATYPVFNQTWDEPAHVAAGMEWIDRGTYTYETLHPPLGRVLTAVGPRLAGIRSGGHESVWLEGNSILHAGGRYDRNLALARLGVLTFFLLASLLVFLWAHRVGGRLAAAGAVLLFTTLPPVLAHAGLATTDMAVTSTVVLAAYCGLLWLDRPTIARSLVLGIAIAAAVLSKFSALLFLPAAAAAIVFVRWRTRESSAEKAPTLSGTRALRVTYLTALLAIWMGYRLDVGPLVPPSASRVEADSAREDPLERLVAAPIFPAPALFEGVGHLAAKNRAGHKSYLLGEVRDTGWWYFFPVALAVKTPLAFLLLVGVGAIAAARAAGRERRRRLEPVAIAFAILLVCLPSRINIGLRHVLPMYPFLAITAGVGLARLVRLRRAAPAGAACAALLLGWHLAVSIRAHPDYLPYFNELVAGRPEGVLVDSDLDSGQDLKRLADTLRARGVPAVWLAYAGSATVTEHNLPAVRWLQPHQPVKGWVAASLYSIKLGSLGARGHDDFAWLERHDPVARVGSSILLYYIP